MDEHLFQQHLAGCSIVTPTGHRTYPLNCWWVAATSKEVTRTPLSRWLLDQRIVLFRTECGAVVALEDRCAHRWAPLSRGRLIGNEIACPYHGFRYGRDGACTHVPTQVHVPVALRVKSFATRERGPFVWIWTGDGPADVTRLPQVEWPTEPDFVHFGGYTEAACSYSAIQENLMDDAHFNYLHCPAHIDWQEPPALWTLPVDIETTARTVTTIMRLLNMPLAPLEALAMGFDPGKRMNRLGRCTSVPPGGYFASWTFEDPAPLPGKRSSFHLRAIHGITPVCADRSHWWWAYAQDYGQHAIRAFEAGWQALLKQDQEMLESIEVTIGRDSYHVPLPQVLVMADRSLGALRRILRSMIESETTSERRTWENNRSDGSLI